jgi:hypothetical protein
MRPTTGSGNRPQAGISMEPSTLRAFSVFVALVSACIVPACGSGEGEPDSHPVRLIFDTDWGPDVDDEGATSLDAVNNVLLP